MRWFAIVGLVGGIALLAVLGRSFGGPSLWAALVTSAVPVAWVAAYRTISLVLCTLSWQALLPRAERPRFRTLLRLRWIGESINSLLPVGQLGGDLVRARRVTVLGVRGADAAASMTADLSIGTLSQVVFVIVAALAFSARADVGELAQPIGIGLAFVSVIGVGSGAVLHVGIGRLTSFVPLWHRLTRKWARVAGGTARLDVALQELVSRRRELAASFAWHLLAWLVQAGEVALALWLIGAPVAWHEALIIEGLPAALRAAAFFVPGGLGVQDAALIYLCHRLGVPAQAALTLALLKRLRELVVGVPGLAAWVFSEWRARAKPLK